MNTANSLRPRSASAFVAALLAGGLGVSSASKAEYYSFGQGGSGWNGGSIQANGDAAVVDLGGGGQAMRLAPDEQGKAGSAFLTDGFKHVEHITSTFVFRMDSPSNPGSTNTDPRSDGLAFIIAQSPAALGGGGGALGYGGSTNGTAVSPSLEIEFDTHHNANDPATPYPRIGNNYNPADSHVAIMKNGDDGNHLKWTGTPLPLDNGDKWRATIDYYYLNYNTFHVSVSLEDLDQSVGFVSFNHNFNYMDIPGITNCNRTCPVPMYFGFTAGTGLGTANHDIISWDLLVDVPEPASPSLLAVGLLALLRNRRRRGTGRFS